MDKIQKRKKKTNKLKNTHPKYNTLERYLTITFMIFRKIKKNTMATYYLPSDYNIHRGFDRASLIDK